MSLPVGEVGAGFIGGGTLVALAIKLLPFLLRKINGKRASNNNSVKPGTAKICIKQGLKIKEHDMAIVGLCGSVKRIEKQQETVRKENREDHQLMFAKLDEINK